MIDRRIRNAGVRLIEEALSKIAFDTIHAPTLESLRAKKTRELNAPTATAVVPKVVSAPTT